MSANKKFSEGDIVTVLPYDEIAAKFVSGCKLPSGCSFPDAMKAYCEKDYIVKSVFVHTWCEGVGFYTLCTPQGKLVGWSFTDEMLEDIVSVSPGTFVDGGILFDDIMNFGE